MRRGVGGLHDDGQVGEAAVGLDAGQQARAAHARHPALEQREVELHAAVLQDVPCLFGIAHAAHPVGRQMFG
ncbi:hypothetical protein GCM10023144_12790 [Pigmentiphaga soli]|uniref:Uncharacterized protein n=1 Tax=Pigmentiphaga soli TaxID=1007095 RepID=A0ABP8GNX8_9BURK